MQLLPQFILKRIHLEVVNGVLKFIEVLYHMSFKLFLLIYINKLKVLFIKEKANLDEMTDSIFILCLFILHVKVFVRFIWVMGIPPHASTPLAKILLVYKPSCLPLMMLVLLKDNIESSPSSLVEKGWLLFQLPKLSFYFICKHLLLFQLALKIINLGIKFGLRFFILFFMLFL